jgi:hypothetical protein
MEMGIIRILIFNSPVVRLLITKYSANLPTQSQSLDIVRKINGQEILGPNDIRPFIQVLSEFQTYLINNNLTSRIQRIRKLVGDGQKWKGFLNILLEQQHEVYICFYEPGFLQNKREQIKKIIGEDYNNIRILGSLNLDENEEIYSLLDTQFKLPIYPFITNHFDSKWMSIFTFSPHIPCTFYFPDGINTYKYMEKIQGICKAEQLNRFILKDEYDVDFRSVIPYPVIPLNQVEQYSKSYYDKSQGISNLGGLLLEEFISENNVINLHRCHIFGQLIPGGVLKIKFIMKPNQEGELFEKLTEKIEEQSAEIKPNIYELFKPSIERYYPYLFSSLEYITQGTTLKVIDINSITNSFGFMNIPANFNPDNLFRFYISKVIEYKNEEIYTKQKQYAMKITNLYKEIIKLGPCFIKEDKLIRLDDMAELSVKKFLEEKWN